jgi:hypothetical protein
VLRKLRNKRMPPVTPMARSATVQNIAMKKRRTEPGPVVCIPYYSLKLPGMLILWMFRRRKEEEEEEEIEKEKDPA